MGDWNRTGKVNNPEVAKWLSASNKGLVYTMFEKDSDLKMLEFFHHFPKHNYKNVFFHDVECDETPNGHACSSPDGSSCHSDDPIPGKCECFDNAHCEMV